MTPDFSRIRPFTVGTSTYDGAYVQACIAYSGDLDRDLREIYAWIAFWGAVAADAKQGYDAKEAAYRTARDRFVVGKVLGSAKITKTLASNELWRGEPEYLQWEATKSEAERAWNIAAAVHEACDRKAGLLQSQVKLFLADVGAYGRSARGTTPPDGHGEPR